MEKKQRYLAVFTLLPHEALLSLYTEQGEYKTDGDAFLNYICTQRKDVLNFLTPSVTLVNPEKLPINSSWKDNTSTNQNNPRKINRETFDELKQASEDFDLNRGIPDDIVITKIIRLTLVNVDVN